MKIIPLYTSRGDVAAYLAYPHLYNLDGEWIGFCSVERVVYSVLGEYVGHISKDQRVLRERTLTARFQRREPPTRPPAMHPPSGAPLAPLMSELTHSTVDVLLEQPERLHTIDMGELRPDLR